MQKTFESVYENGVLRPLEALPLANGQHVKVTIATEPELDCDASAYFDLQEWEAAKTDPITREEVWQATASIRGSLADAVIASREERF
jgi:predicted DNA-binding antitoxin AbrB/MazE fold protein